jgi:hypothetical protein
MAMAIYQFSASLIRYPVEAIVFDGLGPTLCRVCAKWGAICSYISWTVLCSPCPGSLNASIGCGVGLVLGFDTLTGREAGCALGPAPAEEGESAIIDEV